MTQASSKPPYRRGPLKTVWPSSARPLSHRAARRADEGYGRSDTPDWRDIDWPAHTHQVEVDGIPVNYVDIGEGVPVVFIHGLGGCWQNWLENLPRFAEGHRAIALDLPGFGRTPMPAEPISITFFARIVDHFCEALDLGRVSLVGNSMGGFTAAETAIRHPERVDELVLVDAAGITSATISESPIGERFARAVLSRGQQDGSADLSRLLKRPGLIALAMGFVARYPTLIVQGAEDILVPLGDAHHYAEVIEGGEIVVFDDTGHVPMLERPVDFNSAVIEFIDRAGVQ
ncbi:MAG: alpha/beta fold hydrolase [Solirubrobacterales bacterium]